MMNDNLERRCTDCMLKIKDCSTWEEKSETTVSGWDKNRFAISCREYRNINVKD